MKPGDTYSAQEPEFIGAMPIRTELHVLPPPSGPSLGEKEMEEFGGTALRVFAPHDLPPGEDNVLDETWPLKDGMSVLVRGKNGGFFMTSLDQDRNGWFVLVGETDKRVKLPVELDPVRRFWVVRSLP